jgi:hypothetical protein
MCRECSIKEQPGGKSDCLVIPDQSQLDDVTQAKLVEDTGEIGGSLNAMLIHR